MSILAMELERNIKTKGDTIDDTLCQITKGAKCQKAAVSHATRRG